MKLKDWLIALILTLMVVLLGKYNSLALDNQKQITAMQSTITTLETKLHDTNTRLKQIQSEFIPRNEIEAILDELEGYRLKVDDMVFSYMTLDEILTQMFSYEQAQVMRGR